MSEVLKKRIERVRKKKLFWNLFGIFFLASAIFFLSLEFVYSKTQGIKIWGTEKGLIIKTQENNLVSFGEISENQLKRFQGNFMSYLNNPVDITRLENLKLNQRIKSKDFKITKLTENLFMGNIAHHKFFFMTKDFKEFPYQLPIKTLSDFWILENYNAAVLNLPKPELAIFVLSDRKPTKKFQKIKIPIINTKNNWILEFMGKNRKFWVEN